LAKVDPLRVSIISIDPELLFCAIKRVVDVFQIGSPIVVFLTSVSSAARLRAVSTTFGDGETGYGRRRGSIAFTIFRP
jgi:hypothetical protein